MSLIDQILERLPGSWQMPAGTAFAFGENPKAGGSDVNFPTCNASRRGEIRLQTGTAGIFDNLWMCCKNDADVYEWSVIAPPDSFAFDFLDDHLPAALTTYLPAALPAALPSSLRFFFTQGTAVTGTNASTSTYVTFLTMSRLLPAGNWDVTVVANLNSYNDTAVSGIEARISAPFTGSSLSRAGFAALEPNPISVGGNSIIASDGIANTTITCQYRAFGGGTATGQTGTMFAYCVKQ